MTLDLDPNVLICLIVAVCTWACVNVSTTEICYTIRDCYEKRTK